jgi:uncharacterized membrane protein YwzB
LLEKAESAGIIFTTERQFGQSKEIVYISLKLDILSLESIFWVLRSLKTDEMTPNERAVQSRLKEAFSYKITASIWDQIFKLLNPPSAFTNEVLQ